MSDFRARLLAHGTEQQLFERLLVVRREKEVLKARGKQRTDSTRVLSAVRELNRLKVLVEVAPGWLNT